jgi:hypothetical protein
MKHHTLLRLIGAAALSTVGLVGVSTLGASASAGGGRILYSSLPNPAPGNLPSVGAEAYAFNEFGNEVTMGSNNDRAVTNVTLGLSSWACVSGNWSNTDCVTPAGSTFSMPMTLNLYNAPAVASNTPGSLIASITQTFTIPYRPSDSPECSGSYAGEWFDAATSTCYHGLYSTVTFNVDGVKLPTTFVYGISYNTSNFGPSPFGDATACRASEQGCPYDSLNIALSTDNPGQANTNVTVGTDPNPGTVFQNSPYGGEYCDGGTAGTGSFRLDSPGAGNGCWGQNSPYTSAPYYVPAIEFQTGNAS